MYRMITGKVPAESVERALDDDLQEPSKLGITINPSMENALMNALNVYQKDRTPSAEVFYRELTSGNTQRIKVKRKKRETGKLPVWAKGLVAVAMCGLIAGGALLVRQGMENKEKKMVGQGRANSLKILISIMMILRLNGRNTVLTLTMWRRNTAMIPM